MKDYTKLLSLPLQEGKMTESNKYMYDCACAHVFVCAYVCGGQKTVSGVIPQKEGTKDSRQSQSWGRQPCGLVISSSWCPAPGLLTSVTLSEGVIPSPGVLCALELYIHPCYHLTLWRGGGDPERESGL